MKRPQQMGAYAVTCFQATLNINISSLCGSALLVSVWEFQKFRVGIIGGYDISG